MDQTTDQTTPAAAAADHDAISTADLFVIEDFAKQLPPAMGEHNLRYQLRHRGTNGLNSACIRIGKRLMISKSRYERWLATQVEAVKNA